MLYNQFQDLSLSALGFGAMRLPMCPDGTINAAELDRMVDAAIAAGVNYFDTAHPYHDGKSEVELGRSLRRYPRESWYLADKFPGQQNVRLFRFLPAAQRQRELPALLRQPGQPLHGFFPRAEEGGTHPPSRLLLPCRARGS